MHTEYSLLDGACRIKDIPKAVKAAGHNAVAITDHGVMYGAVAFYNACKAEGIKPIIGCEVYLAPRSRFDKNYAEDSELSHLVLLCENSIGYSNLIKLVSLGFTEGFYIKPRVDMELLRRYHEGLIALSGCLSGKIQKMIAATDIAGATALALELRDIFGEGNFYLELQNHGIALQDRVAHGECLISEKTGIPLVATNDVHYLRRADAETQNVMMCIQTNTKLTDSSSIGFETNEFYYKTTEEMEKLFSSHPEAIENTVKIAERCNFDFNFGKYILPSFQTVDGSEPSQYLSRIAYQGLEQRLRDGSIVFAVGHEEEDYKKRVEYELSVINGMGYSEYYLIVADFVNYAKSKGIPVGPGRGSGAGSLVAYLIRITDVDPIKNGLLFERFLNPERVSMPDFDIDFCYIRRGEVIQYVSEKYGYDRVSQIIAFGTLAANAAVRDVGRAMGMSYAEVDAVAKAIPRQPGITLAEAEKSKQLREMAEASPEIRRLLNTAKALEGMPHHASTHAAGVVISDRAVSDYVPLAVNKNIPITQYDMDTVAALGLLKFDFLGLRYLTVINDTVIQIREKEPNFLIETISEDDVGTFEMLSSGNSAGVFQLESAGMQTMLTEFRPTSVQDIMIVNALYRPGPMDAIPKVLEHRRGKTVEYEIPELAPILDSTYGCVIYQEQVMEIFRRLAGYSLGKADIVRRAISKKKPEVIKAQREDFLHGCIENGIDEGAAGRLFDDIVSFAGYAFNKSHAAAYAVLSYRTAYLKYHYPAEYMAALMTSEFGDHGKLAKYTADAEKMGISLLAPSVNESMTGFHVDASGKNIRYGLLALKNVGQAFADKLIEERKNNGPFKGLPELVSRMYGSELNKRQIEALIKAGAFDGIEAKRSQLLACYEDVIERISDRQRGNIEGQLNLFAQVGESADDGYAYPDIPELSLRERLALEKEASGMYFSGHVTDEYSENAEDAGAVSISDIISAFDDDNETPAYREKQLVVVAGAVSSRTVKKTKNGESMAFITLEDRYGEIECILFPKLYTEYAQLALPDSVIAVCGEISLREDEPPKLLLRAVAPLRVNGKYTHRPSPFGDIMNGDTKSRYSTNYSYNKLNVGELPRQFSSSNYGTQGENVASKDDASVGVSLKVSSRPIYSAEVYDHERKYNKLFLKITEPNSSETKRAESLLRIFASEQGEEKAQVIFFDPETKLYTPRPEFDCAPIAMVVTELKKLLGDENVACR